MRDRARLARSVHAVSLPKPTEPESVKPLGEQSNEPRRRDGMVVERQQQTAAFNTERPCHLAPHRDRRASTTMMSTMKPVAHSIALQLER